MPFLSIGLERFPSQAVSKSDIFTMTLGPIEVDKCFQNSMGINSGNSLPRIL